MALQTTPQLIDANNNFFLSLMTSITCDEDNIVLENKQNKGELCLISKEPLEDNHITFHCGHSFNYDPLFHALYMNKKYYSHFDCHVKRNKIKCPYCRKFQKGVLPYRQGYAKVNGLNYPESHAMLVNKCKHIFKSGWRKGKSCDKFCKDEYCSRHAKVNTNQNTNTNTNNNTVSCTAILKSGARKGQMCGAKCKGDSNLCGRHNKINIT